eukprot:Platyproteum_vivax@DN15423_c0_g1_i1.p1
MNGDPLQSCIATYASATDAQKALETLNGQNDKLGQGISVVKTDMTGPVKNMEWGRTQAHPGTDGRGVMVGYKRKVSRDIVRNHFQSLMGDLKCIESHIRQRAKGISLIRFNTVGNAQEAVKKIDKSQLEGSPCRATISKINIPDQIKPESEAR